MLRFDAQTLAPLTLPSVSSSTPFASPPRLKQLWGFTGWFLFGDRRSGAPAEAAFFSGQLRLELPSRELSGIICDTFGFSLIVGDWPEEGPLRFWKVYFTRWSGAARFPIRYELIPDDGNYAGAYHYTDLLSGVDHAGAARMDLRLALESDLVLHWMLPGENHRDEAESRIADYIRSLEQREATGTTA